MSGRGVFKWYDGKIYEGEFKRNKLHGNGELYYPNGQMARGVWEFGENLNIEMFTQGRSTVK